MLNLRRDFGGVEFQPGFVSTRFIWGRSQCREPGKQEQMNRLEGQVAIVTGAGTGIGRAAAKMLAAIHDA